MESDTQDSSLDSQPEQLELDLRYPIDLKKLKKTSLKDAQTYFETLMLSITRTPQ